MPTDTLAELLAGLADLVPSLQAHAPELDGHATFPKADFDVLRQIGLLEATLPVEAGGAGLGSGLAGADALFQVLALLGEGHLAVARLYEAHVNALQLAFRYGNPELKAQTAADAKAGHLFALWVTDPPEDGLYLLAGGVLTGAKLFCSAAGIATRALVTAHTDAGVQMLIIDVTAARTEPARLRLSGMRAAVTGAARFDGIAVAPWQCLGAPGDYLREPVFSAGAWRGSAAALGGAMALVTLYRDELNARHRADHPAQAARLGQCFIATETSRLWAGEAARRACLENRPTDEIIAYVNLARIAVEAACLDVIRLVSRGLGVSCFAIGHPAERVMRDLAVFLRQPAPDETLATAAAYYAAQPALPA